MGNNRIWHPSFGWFTRTEVENLNAMKDGGTYRNKRKELDKEAAAAVRREEKRRKEIPFPPLKTLIAIVVAVAISTPAAASDTGKSLVCPAGTFRAVEVVEFDGQSATVEVSCRALPDVGYIKYDHATAGRAVEINSSTVTEGRNDDE